MKLHTDFHDYYDNAIGYGIDKRVHYNRFTKEVDIRIKTNFDFPDFRNVGLIGFCGKIYPFIKIKKLDRPLDFYCHSGWEDSKVVEIYHAYSLEEYKNRESEWGEYSDSFVYLDRIREMKIRQFFIDWDYQSDVIFLEYKVPVWTIKLERNQHRGILNPRLKDHGFDRKKDSFTAFQEISMYLSNILIEQKETISIEDKFRIEQHGFDLKKSFRKEKKQ